MINESMLDRLKAGDASVVDDAIMAHLDLAKKIAKYFARKHPRKADDIGSVALLGLCKAINNIKNGILETDKVKTYINNTIRGHVKHFIQKDHLVPIPNWYLGKHMDKDSFMLPITYTIDRREEDEENVEEGEVLSFDIEAPDIGDKDFINEFYMRLTNFEKIVLDLRAEGFTLIEIGKRVSKSYVWINKTLDKIRDKMITERRKHGR